MMRRGLKKTGRMLTVALAACVSMIMCVPVFAADAQVPARTYKVRVYSGQRGLIDGKTVWEQDYNVGERVNFTAQRSVSLSGEDAGKYYVKGIRESGKDYKEDNPSFVVDRDIDYVVSYGILGSSVAYTVNYLDGEGNALLPSETFYGNVGDQPVIAYQYIENWLPQAYNLTKTLSENAAENVFDFVYTRVEGPQAYVEPGTGDDGTGTGAGNGAAEGNGAAAGTDAADGAGAGAAAGAGAGAAGGAVVPDEQTPADLQNLDDEETPLANISNGIKEIMPDDFVELIGNLPIAARVLIGAAAAVVIALCVLMLTKRRRKSRVTENREQRND